MADRGGFGRGGRGGDRGGDRRGGDRGGRGGDRGGRRGARRGGRGDEEKVAWVPVTKLGRLVQAGLIRSLEEIFLHSLVIKEPEIVDYFYGVGEDSKLKDEVLKISPVQMQTAAGQRTRFRAYVVVGDGDGHIGLGLKTASEVANAIKGAIWAAKRAIAPVRRGYWGLMAGKPHTVPVKVSGASGSVRVRIIPAPRGTGLVAAPTTKKILMKAGLEDAYTSTRGNSKTMGNFVRACVLALQATYKYLTPDLWAERKLVSIPYETHAEFLAKGAKSAGRR